MMEKNKGGEDTETKGNVSQLPHPTPPVPNKLRAQARPFIPSWQRQKATNVTRNERKGGGEKTYAQRVVGGSSWKHRNAVRHHQHQHHHPTGGANGLGAGYMTTPNEQSSSYHPADNYRQFQQRGRGGGGVSGPAAPFSTHLNINSSSRDNNNNNNTSLTFHGKSQNDITYRQQGFSYISTREGYGNQRGYSSRGQHGRGGGRSAGRKGRRDDHPNYLSSSSSSSVFGAATSSTIASGAAPAKSSWASRVGRKASAPPPPPGTTSTNGEEQHLKEPTPRTAKFQSTTGFNVVPPSSSSDMMKTDGMEAASSPSPLSVDLRPGGLHSLIITSASGISSSNRSKSSTPRSLTTSEGDGTSSAHLRILFKKSVSEAAREYFQSFEKVELGRRVLAALDIFGNSLRPEVTKIIVRLGLDQKEVCRKQLVPLFEYLTTERVLRPIEVFNGLYYLSQQIDDVIMDVPDARRMLGEIVNASSKFGLSPKQLRQLSTVAMNSKPTRRVKDRFGQIIREFLASNDVKEVARSFIEMKAPHFGHQLIKTALSMAMDRSRKDLVKVNKLVADLHSRKAVKPQEMFQGFEKLLQILEELSMDVPDASDQLEEAITSAIVCGALDSSFLRNVHLLDRDKGFEVIESVRRRLEDTGFNTTPSSSVLSGGGGFDFKNSSSKGIHSIQQQRQHLASSLGEAKGGGGGGGGGRVVEGEGVVVTAAEGAGGGAINDDSSSSINHVKHHHVEIIDMARETSSNILINPSFGASVDDSSSSNAAAKKGGDKTNNNGGIVVSQKKQISKRKGGEDHRHHHHPSHVSLLSQRGGDGKELLLRGDDGGNRGQRKVQAEEDQEEEREQEKDRGSPSGGRVIQHTTKKTKAIKDVKEEEGKERQQRINTEVKLKQHREETAGGESSSSSSLQQQQQQQQSVGKWVVPQRRKTSLADFTLESVVGRGSYGKVFLVKHNKLKTLFAMKVLRKDEIVKRDVVDNIQLERKVLETVDHPFLVALRYAFQTPAKLYMVMDYIPGGELFSLLSNKHELSVKDTRFYAAELVVALAHLHSLNIIYRDLKPENILLHSDGHIALTDFGFAKTDIDGDGKTRSFCGTIDYMAPEVIQKTGHGQGADWWALGVLIFEVAVGRMPFQGANRKGTQYSICHHKLRFPKFFDFDLRLLLQGLLRRNLKRRLGCGQKGAEDIKKHDFFDGVNWSIVDKKGLIPPFIPKLRNATDVSNFDPEFTRKLI